MNEEKTIKREFVDEAGDNSTLLLEPTNNYQLNMGKRNYKLASNMRPRNNPLVKRRTLFRSDIGFKSSGFAQVAILSAIASIAGLVFIYLLLKM